MPNDRPTIIVPSSKRRKCAVRKSPRDHGQVERDLQDTSSLDNATKLRIALDYRDIALGNSHKTISEICKDKQGRIICNRDYPKKIYDKLQSTGSVTDRRRSGRPTVKTPAKQKQVIKAIRGNRSMTAKQLAKKLKVGVGTAHGMRKELGFRGSTTKVRPILTTENMKKRKAWALENRHNEWTHVVDCDFWWCRSGRKTKKKFYRTGSPREVQHTKHKSHSEKVMFGGGVNVTHGKIVLTECFKTHIYTKGGSVNPKGSKKRINRNVDNEYLVEKLLPDLVKAIDTKVKSSVFIHVLICITRPI